MSLYVVATPIGNLEDITLRALRVLKEVSLIAAEDTRKTRRLLSAHDIHTPLTSYHEHSGRGKGQHILRVLLDNNDVALVSDAGTPGINDPGYPLIKAAIEEGIDVIPIPGPSAPLAALAVSGMPTHRFTYLGFLPRKKGERHKVLASVGHEAGTLIMFESPHRLLKTLEDLLEVLGDRRITVCREMTKVFEEVYRGRVSEALEYFTKPRGEFTLVVEGMAEKP